MTPKVLNGRPQHLSSFLSCQSTDPKPTESPMYIYTSPSIPLLIFFPLLRMIFPFNIDSNLLTSKTKYNSHSMPSMKAPTTQCPSRSTLLTPFCLFVLITFPPYPSNNAYHAVPGSIFVGFFLLYCEFCENEHFIYVPRTWESD